MTKLTLKPKHSQENALNKAINGMPYENKLILKAKNYKGPVLAKRTIKLNVQKITKKNQTDAAMRKNQHKTNKEEVSKLNGEKSTKKHK